MGIHQERRFLGREIQRSSRGCFRNPIISFRRVLGEDKEVLMEILDLLRLWFRDLLVSKETNEPHYLINQDLEDDVSRKAFLSSWPDLFEKVKILTDVQLALHGNVNPRIAMESMLLKLCQ